MGSINDKRSDSNSSVNGPVNKSFEFLNKAKQLQNLKVKHMTKRNVSSTAVNGAGVGIENHNPNLTVIDKNNGSNSTENTMAGSSGAAKYLINQKHLRPVVDTVGRNGMDVPKMLPNNSNHASATATTAASFQGSAVGH